VVIMRRAHRVDDNQAAIVSAYRLAGYSVQSLAQVGGGVPDLLVGICGINLLVEVKDGAKSKSRRKLTSDQVEWHKKWRGAVLVVESPEDAIKQAAEYVRLALSRQTLVVAIQRIANITAECGRLLHDEAAQRREGE